MNKQIIKCPNCGASYYQELCSTSTCMAWTPTYKDGVLIDKDPNVITTHCHCLNCNKDFEYDK